MKFKPTALLSVAVSFGALTLASAQETQPAPAATLTLQTTQPGPVVNPNLYGHFAEHLGGCIYGGLWVGKDSPIPNTRGIRNDVVAALKDLKIPVLRWPGGCFADEYHWKDGIGPSEKRPSMVNTHWGKVVENNHFGTHEFFDLCEQLGTEPYVCGNVGSGTVEEMMQWVEYMTSDSDSPMPNLRRKNGRDKPWKLKYFGVGNESWGCGGTMRPEYYADEFRRYNTFVKDYSGNSIYRIACGANSADYRWTEALMERGGKKMNGLSLHYYTPPNGKGQRKTRSTEFDEAGWHGAMRGTLFMEELVMNHTAIMDKHDPEKRVGLIIDEWGIWSAVEKDTNPGFLFQQSTMRDAVSAAMHFHIFQRHADRIAMTNIAQMVNVLQSMILTKDEKMLRTPTYWVFEMLKGHQGGKVIPVEIQSPAYTLQDQKVPAISASATLGESGSILLSLVNCNPNQPVSTSVKLPGLQGKKITGRVLTAPTMQAHNTFDQPDAVKPVSFDAFRATGDALSLDIPAKAVITLEIR